MRPEPTATHGGAVPTAQGAAAPIDAPDRAALSPEAQGELTRLLEAIRAKLGAMLQSLETNAPPPKKRRPGARCNTPLNQLPEMSIQRAINYCKEFLGWNIGRGYLNRAIYEGRLQVVRDFSRVDNHRQPRITIRRKDLDALKAAVSTYGPSTTPPPPNVRKLRPAATNRAAKAQAGGAK